MAVKKSRFSNNINIRNKRASYEYEFIDKFVAGIVLKGTEIKSIKEGKANLSDGYCIFYKHELFIRNLHISHYTQGSHFNHDPTRERKLLLSKKELTRLKKKSDVKGLSIIPTKLFVNARGFAKLEVALAKGKKLHDKRQSIKEKDVRHELEREI